MAETLCFPKASGARWAGNAGADAALFPARAGPAAGFAPRPGARYHRRIAALKGPPPVPFSPSAPLDPDARSVIDRLNALNAPGFETMRPAAARAISGQLRQNAPIPQVRVGAAEDAPLGAGAGTMAARIYRPFGAAPPEGHPMLVYLHGGGWTLGDLDTMDHLCRSVVRQAGIAVVSLDYPLSPETQFPQVHQALWEALDALIAEAPRWQLDPARLALGGDSAGGNLAATLALMARDAGGPDLAALCLIYPALDLRPEALPDMLDESTMFLRRATVDWFIGNYLPAPDDAAAWAASPGLAPDLAGLPPCLIVTAGHDVLTPQAEAFARRLRAAEVPTHHRDFPGQIHNFVALPHVIPTAYAALEEIAGFLLGRLAGHEGV